MSDTVPKQEHEEVHANCENPMCPGGGAETYVCDTCGHRFCEKCYLLSSEVYKFLCPGGHRAVNLSEALPTDSTETKEPEPPATLYWT